MGFRFERWTLRPLELPQVRRHCARCGAAARFQCSEKFRVNANKKAIDVWLIYRCVACDSTWNFPVVSRSSVDSLPLARLEAFQSNDRETARSCAFDVVRLRSHVSRIEFTDRVVVERRVEDTAVLQGDLILLSLPMPCELRLDRLLAAHLQLSRSELQRRYSMGKISIAPNRRDALRKHAHDGQCNSFHDAAMFDP
jgi:hypothetical protein